MMQPSSGNNTTATGATKMHPASGAAPLSQQPSASQSLPPVKPQGPEKDKDTSEKLKEGWETFKEKTAEAWETVKEKTAEAYHDIKGDRADTSKPAATGTTASSVDAIGKPSTNVGSSINPAAPGIPYSASATSSHTDLHPVSGTASSGGGSTQAAKPYQAKANLPGSELGGATGLNKNTAGNPQSSFAGKPTTSGASTLGGTSASSSGVTKP